MTVLNPSDGGSSIILELTKLEIKLICQLVHVYMLNDTEPKPLGGRLVQSLKDQTDCYVDTPSLMGVFESMLQAPAQAVTVQECYLDTYEKFYENTNW